MGSLFSSFFHEENKKYLLTGLFQPIFSEFLRKFNGYLKQL